MAQAAKDYDSVPEADMAYEVGTTAPTAARIAHEHAHKAGRGHGSARKRQFDRHSGGRFFRRDHQTEVKEGGGRGNWGHPGEELADEVRIAEEIDAASKEDEVDLQRIAAAARGGGGAGGGEEADKDSGQLTLDQWEQQAHVQHQNFEQKLQSQYKELVHEEPAQLQEFLAKEYEPRSEGREQAD